MEQRPEGKEHQKGLLFSQHRSAPPSICPSAAPHDSTSARKTFSNFFCLCLLSLTGVTCKLEEHLLPMSSGCRLIHLQQGLNGEQSNLLVVCNHQAVSHSVSKTVSRGFKRLRNVSGPQHAPALRVIQPACLCLCSPTTN